VRAAAPRAPRRADPPVRSSLLELEPLPEHDAPGPGPGPGAAPAPAPEPARAWWWPFAPAPEKPAAPQPRMQSEEFGLSFASVLGLGVVGTLAYMAWTGRRR
jgi:hypothetical protein